MLAFKNIKTELTLKYSLLKTVAQLHFSVNDFFY